MTNRRRPFFRTMPKSQLFKVSWYDDTGATHVDLAEGWANALGLAEEMSDEEQNVAFIQPMGFTRHGVLIEDSLAPVARVICGRHVRPEDYNNVDLLEFLEGCQGETLQQQ